MRPDPTTEYPLATASRRLRRGFTLMELAIVTIILALLASIAMPRFADSIARRRVEAAARRVAVDLALARRQARITSSTQTVEFTPNQGFYELVGMKDLEHSANDYVVDLGRAPYEATLYSVDFGGKTQIDFDGYGVPDNGGTVIVTVGKHSKSVTVSVDTGEASVQ